MGKATIIAHKGAGLYEVALNYDASAYTRRVDAFTAALATLDSQLATLADQITAAWHTRRQALDALDAAIAGKVLAAIQAAESKLINANAIYAGLVQTQTIFKTRRLAAARALETLQSTPPADKVIDAWCADFSEELTGVVGTIDPAGKDTATILRPGFDGQATYDASRDGHYRMREHMGPAEVFYNAAIAAGWQIWKPTCRTGILTAVSGDTCSVALDAASLTQQNLNVNVRGEATTAENGTVTPVAILNDVPIVYMSCNGQAFEAGDAVVVYLVGQAWSGARVIGFVREPKPCGMQIIGPGGKKSALWTDAYDRTLPIVLTPSGTYRVTGGKAPYTWALLGAERHWQAQATRLTVAADTGSAVFAATNLYSARSYAAGGDLPFSTGVFKISVTDAEGVVVGLDIAVPRGTTLAYNNGGAEVSHYWQPGVDASVCTDESRPVPGEYTVEFSERSTYTDGNEVIPAANCGSAIASAISLCIPGVASSGTETLIDALEFEVIAGQMICVEKRWWLMTQIVHNKVPYPSGAYVLGAQINLDWQWRTWGRAS